MDENPYKSPDHRPDAPVGVPGTRGALAFALYRKIHISTLVWVLTTIAVFIVGGLFFPETDPMVWGGNFWRLCYFFLMGRAVHQFGALLVLVFWGTLILIPSVVLGWAFAATVALLWTAGKDAASRRK